MAPSSLDSEIDRESDALELEIDEFLSLTDRRNGAVLVSQLPEMRLFTTKEVEIIKEEVEDIRQRGPTILDTLSPTIVIKITRLCNLRCLYCDAWREGPGQIMPFRHMVRAILLPIMLTNLKSVMFVWHGGETTLIKPQYLLKAIWLQEMYRSVNISVSNNIQTNGTGLTDDWLDLLEVLPVSVGVSLDGPPEINDQKRLTKNGGPSSGLVRSGLQQLYKRNISYGVLTVIDRRAVRAGVSRYLSWLAEWNITQLDFLYIAPSEDEIDKGQFDEDFLPVDEFCLWLVEFRMAQRASMLHKIINVRIFRDIEIALTQKRKLSGCYFSGRCFKDVLTINPDAQVTPCDKYVSYRKIVADGPKNNDLIQALARGEALNSELGSMRRISSGSREPVTPCPWLSLCNGACPNDTFALARVRGVPTLGCCGYRGLFDTIAAENVVEEL